MKKPTPPLFATIALAAAACASGAHAQGSVQMYGIMDAGLMVSNTGAPGERNKTELATGNQAGTRLGLRGVEDLGGGLKATFNLEMGISNDTGQLLTFGEAAGTTFGRKSVLGLQGGFGEVTFGRDYTPAWWTIFRTDRFRFGLPGTTATSSGVLVTRANNGIFYVTPAYAGFRGRLAYTFGAESTEAPRDRGRLAGASLEYQSGHLFVAAAVQRRRDATPGVAGDSSSTIERGIGAEYTLGRYAFSTGFWQADPVTRTTGAVDNSRAVWLGASMALGAGKVQAQVTRTSVDVVGRRPGRAYTAGVAYIHSLSRRTSLYAGIGTVRNDDNARLALNTGTVRVGGSVFGADPRAMLVGVRHDF